MEIKNFEILPEKWYMRITKSNKDLILNGMGKKVSKKYKYIYGENIKGKLFIYIYLNEESTPSKNYGVEISTSAFNNYVQKEHKRLSSEEHNSIKYKAPFDMFNGFISKGDLYYPIRNSTLYGSYSHYFSGMKPFIYTYDWNKLELPEEIVQTWEKCYKREYVEFGSGHIEIDKLDSGITIRRFKGNREYKSESIDWMYRTFNHFTSKEFKKFFPEGINLGGLTGNWTDFLNIYKKIKEISNE